MTPPERLIPSPDALETQVGDETVLLHLGSSTYFGLDAVGTRIWNLLKQGLDKPAIRDRMTAEYDVEAEVLDADIERLIGELRSHDLLVNG